MFCIKFFVNGNVFKLHEHHSQIQSKNLPRNRSKKSFETKLINLCFSNELQMMFSRLSESQKTYEKSAENTIKSFAGFQIESDYNSRYFYGSHIDTVFDRIFIVSTDFYIIENSSIFFSISVMPTEQSDKIGFLLKSS